MTTNNNNFKATQAQLSEHSASRFREKTSSTELLIKNHDPRRQHKHMNYGAISGRCSQIKAGHDDQEMKLENPRHLFLKEFPISTETSTPIIPGLRFDTFLSQILLFRCCSQRSSNPRPGVVESKIRKSPPTDQKSVHSFVLAIAAIGA